MTRPAGDIDRGRQSDGVGPRWRAAAAGLLAALLAGLAGCVMTPLPERHWLSLHTEHYELWSSLSDAGTTRLAVELERFRAAAGFIWGRKLPAAPVRTRVYAFDDRGVGRPFAYRYQRGYLLPRERGDVIVLRTGGGWEGDAWTDLKLDYARRLYSNAAPDEIPPWFEEGMAQVASTLGSSDDGAILGVPRADHVRTLRENQWIPFRRMLGASDLIGWSTLERTLFDAESWALCHYLAIGDAHGGRFGAAFARFRSLLEGGSAPLAAARAAFGDETGLERKVLHHVTATQSDTLTVRIAWTGPPPVGRAVTKDEILEELGGLALAIGSPERAARFLEPAVKRGAASPRAIAAAGDALEAMGEAGAADARYRAALAAAPDDPIVQLGRANLLRSRAAATADPGPRAALVVRAREHYQRAIELDPRLPEAYAGLAATHLVGGERPAAGRAAARTARTLLPGDFGIRMLGARLALAAGDREAARREAVRSFGLARSQSDLEASRRLLEQIDSRAAIR